MCSVVSLAGYTAYPPLRSAIAGLDSGDGRAPDFRVLEWSVSLAVLADNARVYDGVLVMKAWDSGYRRCQQQLIILQ